MNRLIDLMRHGEPLGGNKFRGRQDDPLTPIGWAQMHHTVNAMIERHTSKIRTVPWTSVITSPALRCQEFAREIATRHHLPLRIEEELWEYSFGEWEGMEIGDVPQDMLKQWMSDLESYTPPNGEPLYEFVGRIAGAWQRILVETTDHHPLVIAHGGVIRAILSLILKMEERHLGLIEVPYACHTRLQVNTRHQCIMLLSHGNP